MHATTTQPLAGTPPDTLPDDVRLLKDMIRELLASLQQSQHEAEGLRQRLDQLLRRLYGPRAERWDPNQPLLFPEILAALNEAPAPAPPAAAQANGKPKHPSGHGRQQLPKHLPRQRREVDVPAADKQCPCCGGQRTKIGEETSEQIDYQPASLFIVETVRPKYACPKCATGVVTAPKPPQVIDKGLAGPGLLAQVVVSKFADHLPLYRQEQILTRHGVHLPRSTLGAWMAQTSEALRPVYDLMKLAVVQSAVLHADATSVHVQDDEVKGKTRVGNFWAFVGDAGHPHAVFAFAANQSQEIPKNFLANFRGILQADAGTVYDPILRAYPAIVEAGCWAHARRYFFEAKDSHPQVAHQALAYIRRLYAVESEAKDLSLTQRLALLLEPGDAEQEQRLAAIADYAERLQELLVLVQRLRQAEQAWQQAQQDSTLPLEQCLACWDEQDRLTSAVDYASMVLVRFKLRRFFAVPKLEIFQPWLEEQRLLADLPKSAVGKAIAYALGNWEALKRYTSNGALDIDNNLAERTLRQVALGRKNWLFLGSDQGGKTAEVHLTLVATCKALGIEPFAYLRDVLTRLPTHPPDRRKELVPDEWARLKRRQLIQEELTKKRTAS
jgi:transposase